MSSNIDLKTYEELLASHNEKRLPYGIKIIKIGDKLIFARYTFGSWKQVSQYEALRCLEILNGP
jgi:hypothetical protein